MKVVTLLKKSNSKLYSFEIIFFNFQLDN
ncbi:uncharacterized protein METZ01_LOCUS248102 [marine metagenome]|uniref:Uncharacterized protein n=1 Tax=marine metagenome TaxID=408172 RepID=A0A382I6T5_9ZZZZ